MQRIHFLIIPRRKHEIGSKNTYMAKDGRFWPLFAKRENVRTFSALEDFQKSFNIFKLQPFP